MPPGIQTAEAQEPAGRLQSTNPGRKQPGGTDLTTAAGAAQRKYVMAESVGPTATEENYISQKRLRRILASRPGFRREADVQRWAELLGTQTGLAEGTR